MAKRNRNSSGLRVTARGNRLYVTGTLLGQEVRRSTGLSLCQSDVAEAIRINTEREILHGTFGLRDTKHTFTDAASAYQEWKILEGGLTKDLQRRVNFFVRHWGDHPLDGITREKIISWSAKTYKVL